jgi:alpha-2-macroglobulin
VAFASATWHFSTEKMPTEGSGDFFSVSRAFFKREHRGQGFVLVPLTEGTPLQVGDEIEVQLSLKSKNPAEYVHLRVPTGAGFEPENAVSRYKWELGIGWYEETRDSGKNFFFERLPQGEYPFRYRLRASMAGAFRVGPATVQSMYAPEFNAYSSGAVIKVGAR